MIRLDEREKTGETAKKYGGGDRMVDDKCGKGISLTGRTNGMLNSVVANEVGEKKSSGRVLRGRNPVQVHPYGVEREEYKKMKKGGRVEGK